MRSTKKKSGTTRKTTSLSSKRKTASTSKRQTSSASARQKHNHNTRQSLNLSSRKSQNQKTRLGSGRRYHDSDIAEYERYEDEDRFNPDRDTVRDYDNDYEDYDEDSDYDYDAVNYGTRHSFGNFRNNGEDYDRLRSYEEEEPDTYQHEEYGSRRGYSYEDEGNSGPRRNRNSGYGWKQGNYDKGGHRYRTSYGSNNDQGRNDQQNYWGTRGWKDERGTHSGTGSYGFTRGRLGSMYGRGSWRTNGHGGSNEWLNGSSTASRIRANGNYGSARRNGSSNRNGKVIRRRNRSRSKSNW